APGSGTPTGSVDFFDTTINTDLGSVNLSGGGASLSTTSLPMGGQTIMATYSGDPNFLSSSGSVSVGTVTSIYVLNSTVAGAVSLSGNADIDVPGVIVVDSKSTTAVTASGNATVTAAGLQIVGGLSSSDNAHLSPQPVTGAAPVADPLANLAAP